MKKLLATGIILSLIGSNIVIGHQYLMDSKENKRTIHNQTKTITNQMQLIKQHETNMRKQQQTINDQLKEVNVLQQQNSILKTQLDDANKVKLQLQQRLSKMKYFQVSAYTSGYESTQKSKGDVGYGITASGTYVKEGRTIACPPSLKFGTKLNIEDIGLRVCEDRGQGITSGKLDLYVESLSNALSFGKKTLMVEILN